MQNSILLFFILLYSIRCFSQISEGQERLLQSAFKKRDTTLLSKFIYKWQSDTKYDKKQSTDDTIRCVYDIFKDMLSDTDSRVIRLFTYNHNPDKYSIVPSQVKYAVIHELNPDSVVINSLRNSKIADTLKHKLLSNYSRSNDMLFENLYNVYLPDSLFKSLQDFYPDNTKQYLYKNTDYDKLLSDFLSPEYSERRISFLENAIALPERIKKEPNQYKARLSKVDELKILVDDNQEWAVLYTYTNFGGTLVETVFEKKNTTWQYYGLLTIIVN